MKRSYKSTTTTYPTKKARSTRDTSKLTRLVMAAPAYIPRPMLRSKETGYVDLGTNQYAADTTGTITLLATIAQGTTVNQRVGKKALYRSIQCRGEVQSNAATTVAQAAMILVYDRRPTGALPAITDVLVTITSEALNNDANSGRFKILRRLDYTLIGNTTTPTTGKEAVEIDFWFRLKDLPAVFKAAGTGAIADIEEGAIYLVTVGNVAAGTAAAAFNVGFRTRFIDV